MDSTMTCYDCLSMEAFLQRATTFSLAITLTVASSHLKRYASCWPTRSNIRKTSSYFVATMNVRASIGYTDSMMNVSIYTDCKVTNVFPFYKLFQSINC